LETVTSYPAFLEVKAPVCVSLGKRPSRRKHVVRRIVGPRSGLIQIAFHHHLACFLATSPRRHIWQAPDDDELANFSRDDAGCSGLVSE
jgi:hypothetical protein